MSTEKVVDMTTDYVMIVHTRVEFHFQNKINTSMSSAKKSATPSNKSGKAKKRREEEERKRKEEEEAQQRAEIAEKERLENEKRAALEKSVVAKEVNQLRRRELTEFYEFIQPKNDEAKEIQKKRREEFKWKRVMQCDGTPDPTVLPEINTFMSLWRDEHQNTDVNYTIKRTDLVLSLIKELDFVLNTIPNDSSEIERIPIYKQTIHELEDTLQFKWLQALHNVMLRASELQDLETNNLQYTAENENITVCVWGNLSHNARIKSYQFDKHGFGFDLPKPLQLANIAIVGYFLKYDCFSERSLLSQCRIRKTEYSYDPVPEPIVEEPEKPAKENQEENDPLDGLPPELRKLMEQTKQQEEVQDAAVKENSSVSQANNQKDEKSLTQASLDRKKSVTEDKTFNANSDKILEQLADESVIDLRSHSPILPLIQISVFNIPPQPVKVQEWTLVQVDDNNIPIQYQYPSDPSIAQKFYEEFSASNKTKTKTDDKPEETADLSMTLDGTLIDNNPEVRKMFVAAAAKQESPLLIKYKIPNEVLVPGKPLLARWIPDRNYWREEGIVDYQYASDTRIVTFKTYHFGIYALLNDRHAHMPFQSWRMRPKGVNNIIFTLNTQSFEITFEVQGDKVAVVLPSRKVENPAPVDEKPSLFAAKGIKPTVPPQGTTSSLSNNRKAADEPVDIYKTNPTFAAIVEPIANQFMSLNELIGKLRVVGLNVFPEPDSDSYVSVINKNHKLEWWVYNQMAIVSSSTAFSYSHWNAFVNDETKIVVGCKEHLIDQLTHDLDLKCIIFTNELVGFTDICESSQEFVEASTFSDYHAELYHLVREKFSPEAYARVMDSSSLFIETVNQLLFSIKPLTYA